MWVSLMIQLVKNPPAVQRMQETWVQSLGRATVHRVAKGRKGLSLHAQCRVKRYIEILQFCKWGKNIQTENLAWCKHAVFEMSESECELLHRKFRKVGGD